MHFVTRQIVLFKGWKILTSVRNMLQAPDYDDPVFHNIPNEFWDKNEAHKNEASKITEKKRGRKGTKKD